MIGAILGTSVKFETLDGEQDLEIKPGTQDGDRILIEKAGVWPHDPPDNYDPQQLRGDHLITVQVDLPKQGELSEH
jgi:molecular chaperone DnaJ